MSVLRNPRHHPKCKRRRSLPFSRTVVVSGLVGLLVSNTVCAQFVPSTRWGQAWTISGHTLLVHGGKVDPTNSYSYTSAPNTNDLFSLDLSQPFNTSNPPWTFLSGSSNPSTSQGPAVAFHTLSAYSPGRALVFGGDGGPSLPIETNPDSSWTLNFNNLNKVAWTQQPSGWAGQPMRRIYHAAPSSTDGVWITGGQKADGSGTAFTDTYVFNGPVSEHFTAGPTPGCCSLPIDLVGHGSVVSPSGLLLVLGGYSPSTGTLMPMSTLHYLDTTSKTPTWGTFALQGQTPSPRRNFAMTVLDGNRVLIHGGADATLQNFYSDGAILNMQTMNWQPANGVTDVLGPRVGHMAVGLGSNVLFAFGRAGRAPTGPAPAGLLLYNCDNGSFGPSYSPLPTNTANPASATLSGYTTGMNLPTTAITGPILGQPSTVSQSSSPTTGFPGTPGENQGGGDHDKTIAIVLGSVFGFLGALILGITLIWAYFRRKRSAKVGLPWSTGDRSRLMQSSGDTEDPMLPGAVERGQIPVAVSTLGDRPRNKALLGILPLPFQSRPQASMTRRFDMLHDEDAMSFGHLGGPSVSTTVSGPLRPPYQRLGSTTRQLWNDVINASTTSLRVAGAVLGIGSVAAAQPLPVPEKESPEWWDKRDPFSDASVTLSNLPSITAVGMEAATRQRGAGHQANGSYGSSTGYRDPFTDSIGHTRTSSAATGYTEVATSDTFQPFAMPLDDPPPRSTLTSALTTPAGDSSLDHKTLVVGSVPSSVVHSSDTLHPVISTPTTESGSSGDRATSPLPGFTSLIGSAPVTPIKRSDSWWTRFGRSSISSMSRHTSSDRMNPIRALSLRRSPGPSSPRDMLANLDFRDPNPPPRLAGIDETGRSNEPSPSTPQPKKRSANVLEALKNQHSKSRSSVVTADSAALEKMGGRMDVIQRGRTTGSPTSTITDSLNEDWEYGTARLVPLHGASPITMSDLPPLPSPSHPGTKASTLGSPKSATSPASGSLSGTQETFNTAPTHQTRPVPQKKETPESYRTARSSTSPSSGSRKSSGQGVAARVAMFENMSYATSPIAESPADASPSPKSIDVPARMKVVGAVQYGLMERPSLFVANPDRRRTDSTSSMDSRPK
ncbi:hypothetical protein FRB99_005165 [Tulasnella sp. 403]|nr:hypothetical protein FRB99_005165 [Tulasnella sp. 403]